VKGFKGKFGSAPLSPRKSPSLRKLKVVIKPLAYKGPHSPRKRPLTPGKKRRGVLRINAAAAKSISDGFPNPRTVQRQRVSFSEDGNDMNLVPRVEDKAACFYTKADLRRFELDRKTEKQAEQLQNLEEMMAQASLIMSGIPML
jgi:hypothetical protein